MRYDGVNILRDSDTGVRYLRGVKYPRTYPSDNDIYIITVYGDSLDVISYDYYGNVEDYWIIAISNGIPGDSRYVEPGTQLRIPIDTQAIKNEFRRINNIQ
jgi:hypothetical protein